MPIIKGGCSEFTDVVKSGAVANVGVSFAASGGGGRAPRSSGGYVSIAGIGAKVTFSAVAKASGTPSAVVSKIFTSSGVAKSNLITLDGNTVRYIEGAPSIGGSYGMVYDSSGNIYIADTVNHVIRKLTPSGQVTTFCGAEIYSASGSRTGSAGYVNGISSVAKFSSPKGIAIGPDNCIYVADSVNNRIRKITLDGTVSTYAGSTYAYNVDGSIGENAKFMNPRGLSFDPSGNLYVANSDSSQILKISPTRVVTLFAGIGSNGSAEGNAVTVASFFGPCDVKVGLDGTTIYVADTSNNKIRKIAGGIVSTLAVGITTPISMSIEPGTGNLLVGNSNNALLKYITTAGVISSPTQPPVSPTSTSIMYSQNGTIYICYDAGIRFGASSATLTINGSGFVNGNVNAASWTGNNNTTAIRFNKDKTLMYIIDFNKINKYDIETGVLTNVLTDPTYKIKALCIGSNGNVYYTLDSGPAKLYMLTPSGVNSEFCSSFPGYPQNLTIDSNDNIYGIGQLYANRQIYKVSRLGISTVYVGTGEALTVDGSLSSAKFNFIMDMCIDDLGDMYVLEEYCVRKITPTGVVTTLASTHRTGNTNGVDGTGSAAILGSCRSILCDNNGSLYIGENSGNGSGTGIRKIITSSGVVTTLKRFPPISSFYSLGMDKYGYLYATSAFGFPVKIT